MTIKYDDIEKAFGAIEEIKIHHLAPNKHAFEEWETVFRFICICNDHIKNEGECLVSTSFFNDKPDFDLKGRDLDTPKDYISETLSEKIKRWTKWIFN